MLDIVSNSSVDPLGPVSRFSHQIERSREFDLDAIVEIIGRRRRLLSLGVAGGVLLAILYLMAAVPLYTSYVDIMMETPKIKGVSDDYDSTAFAADNGVVDSQVELLRSQHIIGKVIDKLDLKNNGYFTPKVSLTASLLDPLSDLFRTILGWADDEIRQDDAAERTETKTRGIVSVLEKSTEIKRLQRTYVLRLSYTSPDPNLSAAIAQAYADSYLADELDAKYDVTTRATAWLQDRIAELREKSLASDLKVQKFRSDNGLIAVDGRLVDDEQLSSANIQLSEARAKMADAQAKTERIETIIKNKNVDAAVTEALANPVISGLRTKFLDAAKRADEIAKKLGPDHAAATSFRNDMKQYEKLIFDELTRIGESYRSDFQIAKSRIDVLEQNLQDRLARASTNNNTLVALRELERESDTYKALYQTFLTRYQAAIQQLSFPITDARVITVATPPSDPSSPRKLLVLVLGLIGGAMAGVGAAAFAEWQDKAFRTGEQVQQDLGMEFLGMLPIVTDTPVRADAPARPGGLHLSRPAMQHVIRVPLGPFAETLRGIGVSAELALRGRCPKIIGVVSVLPGEGKTMVSKNLASLSASLGTRTLLVDGDLRNPGLTRAIARNAEIGVVEVLRGNTTLEKAWLVEEQTGLHVLPAVVRRRLTNTSGLLSSAAMRGLLEHAGSNHDLIIVDLPPIGPVVDVRAAADLFDAFIFVVEWGKTPRTLVHSVLHSEAAIAEKCLGIVFNKVDFSKISLYRSAGYRGYSYSYYSQGHADGGGE